MSQIFPRNRFRLFIPKILLDALLELAELGSVVRARAGLKAQGLGRVLTGSGLPDAEPEPEVRARAGYGSGLGLGPGLLYKITKRLVYEDSAYHHQMSKMYG